MLIRSMSPGYNVDEVGSDEDIKAIKCVNCGCRLIATVHGDSIEDILNKPILDELVKKRLFERYIILNNESEIGHVEGIYNKEGIKIC